MLVFLKCKICNKYFVEPQTDDVCILCNEGPNEDS